MYQTNVLFKQELIDELIRRGTYCYIHAEARRIRCARLGARGEPGAGAEHHYAVTKNAAAVSSTSRANIAAALRELEALFRLRTAGGSLAPDATLVAAAAARCCRLCRPDTSRDFLYVDDAVRAS